MKDSYASPLSLFFTIGTMPAISPITFTMSLSDGNTIFAFAESEVSTACILRSTCALPTKYFSAASFTNAMACASPSAVRIFACLIPSAFFHGLNNEFFFEFAHRLFE